MNTNPSSLDLYKAINSIRHKGIGRAQSYSGRAMYGKQCVAVEVSSLSDLAVLGRDLHVYGLSIDRLAREIRFDNLGHEYIVYWPNFEWDSKTMVDALDAEEESDD